ncbi:MAG: metallophosphoesterase family protein [Planctomycetota bacterium]
MRVEEDRQASVGVCHVRGQPKIIFGGIIELRRLQAQQLRRLPVRKPFSDEVVLSFSMKIGVLSDTHAAGASDIPTEVFEAFRDVELILHAGDIIELAVIDGLEELAPVRAVYGNMDPPATREALPDKTIIQAEGKRIGLIHGSGGPLGIHNRVRAKFDDVDMIVFGHSHRPINETVDGVLMFNPGSPTDLHFAPYRSFGIISIEGDEILATIVPLD